MQTILYHNSSGREAFTGNLKQKEVHRAITLHPVKQHSHMYRIHNYIKVCKLDWKRFEIRCYSSFPPRRQVLNNISRLFAHGRVSSSKTSNTRRSCFIGTYDPWSISWTTSDTATGTFARERRPATSVWPESRNSSRPAPEVRTTWAIRTCWVKTTRFEPRSL